MKPTERTVVDVATRADKELDKLLNRAAERLGEARAGQEQANREASRLAAEAQRRVAEQQEHHRVLWVEHFRRLAHNHLRLARDARARERKLQNGG